MKIDPNDREAIWEYNTCIMRSSEKDALVI